MKESKRIEKEPLGQRKRACAKVLRQEEIWCLQGTRRLEYRCRVEVGGG